MIVKRLDELNDILHSVCDYTDIYVVGAGNYGYYIGRFLNIEELEWEGYVDRYKYGEILNDKRIVPFNYEFERDSLFILEATSSVKEDMKKQLQERGINEDQIVQFANHDIVYKMMEKTDDLSWYRNDIGLFHNRYYGERCFVLGNGPSLSFDDINRIKNEKVFGANAIVSFAEKLNWFPDFYFAADSVFTNGLMEYKELWMEQHAEFFWPFISAVFRKRKDYQKSNFHYFQSLAVDEKDLKYPYSMDCTEGCFDYQSVVHYMLQFAFFMGFREIYLLGVDFCFPLEKKDGKVIVRDSQREHPEIMDSMVNTVRSKYKGSRDYVDLDPVRDGFIAADNYAKMNGIILQNATRGGNLDVLPRVDFDKLFE